MKHIFMDVAKELERINDQFIEDHLDALETYFMEHDGWNCNKDNIEARFEAWLEDHDYGELVEIIRKMSN